MIQRRNQPVEFRSGHQKFFQPQILKIDFMHILSVKEIVYEWMKINEIVIAPIEICHLIAFAAVMCSCILSHTIERILHSIFNAQ